jgi:DNA-binding PadR family transcriptional regulator
VAVGSINWYLKRLIRKGYVKATQMERRRLKYFVTPQGLALKAKLTSQYMEASLQVYRQLRQAARDTLEQIREAGYTAVEVNDKNDKNEAIEIFHLTCLEEGMPVNKPSPSPLPAVQAQGTHFAVEWPEEES